MTQKGIWDQKILPNENMTEILLCSRYFKKKA